jgi:uncharacterized damage-inducible protein DinB
MFLALPASLMFLGSSSERRIQVTPLLKTVADSFHITNYVLGLCLGDLTDDHARYRTRGGNGPSIAWEVGHMLDFRCTALRLLGVARESAYHAKYSVSRASDGSDYPDVTTYGREWKELNAELERALEAAIPESLEELVEDQVHGTKTVLESLVFVTWHEAYHLGALAAIRKQLGYPGPAELTLAKAAK